MARGPDSRLEPLFAEALDRPSEERRRFLEERCGDEPELLRELTELLAAHDPAGDFFDGLSDQIRAGAETELTNAAQPRFRIGAFQTLQVIGHGGMGAVYRARRVDGAFDQEVALKLPHLDMQTPELRARFLAERQLLAQLEHPNIARLLDGGFTDEGRPFFAMEFIDGRPITVYCREEELALRPLLRLFLEVVEAVSYLHRNLVVHRDLKPSNVLVDRHGRVKLLDFGVAKLLKEDEAAALTLTRERLLTPQYAAPEQLAGGRISTATDVFGLGVLLYELLAGEVPHEATTSEPTGRRPEARPPSAALRQAAAQRGSGAPRRIARDLDNICLRALRPEPERRYPSAEQLGLDIERFLDGLPVTARPSTLGYRARPGAERHRTGLALAAGVLALVTAGVVHERGLRQQAQRQARRAEAVNSILGSLISSVDPANTRGREVDVDEVLEQAERALTAETAMERDDAVEAEVRVVLGQTYSSLGRFAEARAQFERAIELGGGVEGTDESAMRATEGLAVLLREIDPERAQAMLRRVVEVRRRTRGPTDSRTLESMAALSRVLRLPTDYDEAEALDREILEARLATLGPDHLKTLQAMNSLAGVYFGTARYEAAADLYQRAFATAREHLGADHPETLRYGGNLAATFSELGSYRESEEVARDVLASRLRIFGPEHHLTGLSLHNLGILRFKQAGYAEAEGLFRRAMAARQAEGGSMSGYWYSKGFLADSLRELGHTREAEELYLETIAKQRELYGPDISDTYRTMLGLAELRLGLGELGAALKIASEALAGYTGIYGDDHPDVAETMLLLARIERSGGRLPEAAEWADRAIVIFEVELPVGHPDLIDARLERASIHLAAGEAVAAVEGIPELVEMRLDRLGPGHPKSRDALELVAAISEANGRSEEAADYRSRLADE